MGLAFLRLAPRRAAVLTAGIAVLGGGLTLAAFVQAQRGLPVWPL